MEDSLTMKPFAPESVMEAPETSSPPAPVMVWLEEQVLAPASNA